MEPHDEDTINKEDKIIRRINPKQHVIWDDNLDCQRISTKAFSPSSGNRGGMSVDIEALIIAAKLTPQEYVTTPIFTGSVSFTAGAVRALDLLVGLDPLPDNDYHGEVWGKKKPNRFTKSQKRGLLKTAQWYVQLSDIQLEN